MSSDGGVFPGLRFDAAHVHFGPRRRGVDALAGFSLDCRPGSTTCLIGANGAGKSTALALAAALLRPTAGSVSFAGLPVAAATLPAPIGFLPQTSAFPGELQVAEVLNFAFGLRGTPATARDEVIEVAKLREIADQRTRTLSSGWLRRLGLAVALALPGDLLLLDEPFVGVDLETLERLIAYLETRQQQGATILLASHDFETVDRLQPRLVVLREGRLLGKVDAGEDGARQIYRSIAGAAATPGGQPVA